MANNGADGHHLSGAGSGPESIRPAVYPSEEPTRYAMVTVGTIVAVAACQ